VVATQQTHALLGLAICGGILVIPSLPSAYLGRALGMTIWTGLALTIVEYNTSLAPHAYSPEWLLDAGMVVLVGGLWFRSWHRASKLARVIVALGALVCFSWAALSSTNGQLVDLHFHWSSWTPALLWLVLVVLALLSLLAFMGQDTTAGCSVWAVGLSTWFMVHVLTGTLSIWETSLPNDITALLSLLTDAMLRSTLVVLMALSMAQLFVVVSLNRQQGRRLPATDPALPGTEPPR